MTNINEKINKRIIKLWKKYRKDSGKNSPLLYPEFKQNKILFIGLNPSLSKKAFNTITKKKGGEKEEGYEKITYKKLFNKKNLNDYKDKLIKF